MSFNENLRPIGILGKNGWSSKYSPNIRRQVIDQIMNNPKNFAEIEAALKFRLLSDRIRPETRHAIQSDLKYLQLNYGYLRNNPFQKLYYKGHEFDSKGELDCFKFLEQRKIPFEFQKKVGSNRIDFLITDLRLFIEYHPMNFYDNGSAKDYLESRRKILDKFGYNGYILKHVETLGGFIKAIKKQKKFVGLHLIQDRKRELKTCSGSTTEMNDFCEFIIRNDFSMERIGNWLEVEKRFYFYGKRKVPKNKEILSALSNNLKIPLTELKKNYVATVKSPLFVHIEFMKRKNQL